MISNTLGMEQQAKGPEDWLKCDWPARIFPAL